MNTMSPGSGSTRKAAAKSTNIKNLAYVFSFGVLAYIVLTLQAGRLPDVDHALNDDFEHANNLPGHKNTRLSCVVADANKYTRQCFKPGLIPYMNATLPLIVGIGPPKTSTTAVFHHLNESSEIVVADARINNEPCCFMEVFYFTQKFTPAASVEDYGKKYFRIGRPDAKYLADKSTDYGNSLLAPHRINALVSQVVLLYTIRQPLDAHLSSYFFFHSEKLMGDKTNANAHISGKHFLEWSKGALHAHEAVAQCGQDTATSLLQHGMALNPLLTHGVFVSPWVGVQQIDEAVDSHCKSKISQQGNSISNYIYSTTFVRWSRVFPRSPFLCVFQDDMLKDPKKAMLHVARSLGLQDLSYFEDELEWFEFQHGSLVPSMDRIEALIKKDDRATQTAVRAHLKLLREGVFKNEYEFAQQFCAQHFSGF